MLVVFGLFSSTESPKQTGLFISISVYFISIARKFPVKKYDMTICMIAQYDNTMIIYDSMIIWF